MDIQRLLVAKGFAFGLATLAAVIVVWVTYRLSIEQIYSWGEMVKAAFDCYLPALAKRLGYSLPKTEERQRAFWTAVSRRAIYHRLLCPEDWPRAGEKHENNESNDNGGKEDNDDDPDGNKETVAICVGIDVRQSPVIRE